MERNISQHLEFICIFLWMSQKKKAGSPAWPIWRRRVSVSKILGALGQRAYPLSPWLGLLSGNVGLLRSCVDFHIAIHYDIDPETVEHCN